MCISHLEDMITHGHQNTITGHLYRVSIKQLQVEAGVGSDVFDWDYQQFKGATTQTYFQLSGMEMPLQQINDCYLMQVFARKYKAPTLAKLNRFRIHLRVTTLAKVATGNGTTLTPAASAGTRDDTQPHYYLWPVQPRPPTNDLHT